MFRLKTSTITTLAQPTVDDGFVSWLDIEAEWSRDGEVDAIVGNARIALIYVGEANNYGQSIYDVLDTDSAQLEALYEVFFEGPWLKEAFANGGGADVLYFDNVATAPAFRNRGIEEALAQRVIEVWGQGCGIAVMPVGDEGEVAQWGRVGFTVARAPEAGSHGYCVADLSLSRPRVREVDGEDRFLPEPEAN